ncbi:MAG: hypothetical protein R2733_02970 [Acidimicrobiales bacterium]
MTILGAQLDDLSRLSQRLTTTAGDVGGSRDGAIRTTTQVVTGVQEAAQAALEQIMTHMDQLGQSVAASVAEAGATNWTGSNADRFRDGATTFQRSMQAAQNTTTDVFSQFRATIASLSDTLDSYAAALGTQLSDAEQSVQQMSQAVDHQRSNLDSVMNTGLAFS